MYCDYVFIKAKRALQKISEERSRSELKEIAKKCCPIIPKVHIEASPRSTYQYFDYVSRLTISECKPITNPDQLIGWDKNI